MANPRRLFMHVGLPKTGSSALQHWCAASRVTLRKADIEFPDWDPNWVVPRHQFAVRELRTGFFPRLETLLASGHGRHILLTSEGFTNQFFDFPRSALDAFRKVTAEFEKIVFVVLRSDASWMKSYYQQSVINEPNPTYSFGTALRFEEFSKVERVIKLRDLAKDGGDELGNAFGASKVSVTRYEDNWFGQFKTLLGVDRLKGLHQLTRQNASPSDAVIEIIRQINSLALENGVRHDLIKAIGIISINETDSLRHYYGARDWSGASLTVLIDAVSHLVPTSEDVGEIIDKLQYTLTASYCGKTCAF